MNIKETISIIKQMHSDGVIGSYAIGGAVGAAFYIEPSATEDVDVFFALQGSGNESIITLSPIFDYLKARGCKVDGQYIVIADWPVQFLVPDGPLVEEALRQAVEKDFDGVSVRIFTAEHLAAIALKLGRSKDKLRLQQFLEAEAIDDAQFSSILERHNLVDRWLQFKKQLTG